MAIVKDEWLLENGFLTPTMKIKRVTIEKVYGQLADGWYNEEKSVVW